MVQWVLSLRVHLECQPIQVYPVHLLGQVVLMVQWDPRGQMVRFPRQDLVVLCRLLILGFLVILVHLEDRRGRSVLLDRRVLSLLLVLEVRSHLGCLNDTFVHHIRKQLIFYLHL